MKEIVSIAVLGAGIMGNPIARNLGAAGFEVHVWSRTPDKAERAAESEGVHTAPTTQQAVENADAIITVLTDAPATQRVIEQAEPGLRPEQIWLQMGTVGAGIDDLARWAQQRHLHVVDAPLLGSKAPAESGELLVVASGDETLLHAVQPVFDAIASRVVRAGVEVGAASRAKLAVNILVAACTHGVAEGLAFAKAMGVAPDLISDLVAGGPLDSGFIRTKMNAITDDDYEASFTVINAIKDARLTLEAAPEALPLQITRAAHAMWTEAASLGCADKDMIASHLAALSGAEEAHMSRP